MASASFLLEGNVFIPGTLAGPARVRVAAGRIDSCQPSAPQLAVRGPEGGAVSRTGARTAPPGEQPVLRLEADQWLCPGFTDSHTHLLSVGLEPLRPDLGAARSRAALSEMLADWLKRHPGEGPVVAEGWDQSAWADPTLPTRADLDAVTAGRPVAARRVCGHVAVLNSAALRLLGTDWPDLDPESGLAREKLPLSIHRLWPPTEAQFDQAVEIAQTEAWKRGVTAIHEMGHANSFRAFSRAACDGRLRLRVTHFFGVDLLESLEGCGLAPGFGDGFLRAGGLKLFLDGSIGGRSAAVREPYADGDGRGLLLWETGELTGRLRRAFRGRWPVAMHAIGDRAIDQAVSVIEALRAEGVAPPFGPRLEHAEMLDPELLARAAAAGFHFSMQPNFTARWQQPGRLYEAALGPERAARLNPYRSVAATGRLLFGSDTMPMGPLFGLEGALGHPLASERLSFEQAFRAYVLTPSTGVARPFHANRLHPGDPADMALLRLPSPPSAGAAGPGGARIDAVWLDGVLCHADPGFAAPAWLARREPAAL